MLLLAFVVVVVAFACRQLVLVPFGKLGHERSSGSLVFFGEIAVVFDPPLADFVAIFFVCFVSGSVPIPIATNSAVAVAVSAHGQLDRRSDSIFSVLIEILKHPDRQI